MTTTVRERPILFSGDMVRALLAGMKTQTRRVVKPQPAKTRDYAWISGADPAVAPEDAGVWLWEQRWESHENSGRGGEYFAHVRCPFGQPGDRLWVREAFSRCGCDGCHAAWPQRGPHGVTHLATYNGNSDVYPRPSIHMPRWASRLSLEITAVRCERLQEISGEDARAEGVTVTRCGCEACTRSTALCPADASAHIEEYAHLWDELNAESGFGWDANPFVWVITFKRVEG